MAAGGSTKFKKRVITLTRTATGNVTGSVGIGGQRYGVLNSFRAKDTGPTNSILEIKDSLGRIAYLDAATKDYHTATVNRAIAYDDTLTGLGFAATDATGAAMTAGGTFEAPVLEGPLTIRWNNATDTTGTMRVELYLEV